MIRRLWHWFGVKFSEPLGYYWLGPGTAHLLHCSGCGAPCRRKMNDLLSIAIKQPEDSLYYPGLLVSYHFHNERCQRRFVREMTKLGVDFDHG